MGLECRCLGQAERTDGRVLPRLALTLLMTTAGEACFAQSATPGATLLDRIEVSPDEASLSNLEERLEVLPGDVALVTSDRMPASSNLTVSKALATVPGVVVQDFFGGNDQPRIQIRGSGLQQNPVERGVLVLQNGLPINRADGSYIVGFANPYQAQAIEVYRGYMSNRLGATVLGGALNFISPTGYELDGTRVTASGGSFGQASFAGQAGFASETVDGVLMLDASHRDGFREYNTSERMSVGGNVGYQLSDNVTTRIFAGYTDLGFDVAGPLTKKDLETDPTRVHRGPRVTSAGAVDPGPNVLRDRPRREASQFVAGSRTTAEFDAHLLDFSVGYTFTDDSFRFPVSAGVRDTSGGDFTGVIRYAYGPDATSVLPLFEATAQYSLGSADRDYYLNEVGTSGAKFGENRLDATTLSLHTGFNIPILPNLTLSPAISYSHATRDNADRYSLATRPTGGFNPTNPSQALSPGSLAADDTSYARSYDGWSPSLGLSYTPDNGQTFFAAVSRSFEPPTHDDLLATVNGTPNSSPGRPNPASSTLPAAAFVTPDLEAQTATTVEAGWRGAAGAFSWDAVAYHSWIDNELLSLRDSTGAPMGALNADKTTHFGVELGIGAQLTDKLAGRLAYTYQDFRFDGDPLRGDNRLAGAPRHLVHAMLEYRPAEDWILQAAVKWSPEKTPVDNMNTLFADPYAIVDLRAEYSLSENVSFFGEVTNLFDENYASSTLIVDQARPDQAAFLPGDGRAFYAGIKARF